VPIACDDGRACTVGDVCIQGACASGSNVCACEPGFLPCAPPAAPEPDDHCRGELGCVGDGTATSPYAYVQFGTSAVVCSPAQDSGCVRNACDPATGSCTPTPTEGVLLYCPPKGATCNDGDACTFNDGCTFDKGCVHTPAIGAGDAALPCDDGDACSGVDTCVAGSCLEYVDVVTAGQPKGSVAIAGRSKTGNAAFGVLEADDSMSMEVHLGHTTGSGRAFGAATYKDDDIVAGRHSRTPAVASTTGLLARITQSGKILWIKGQLPPANAYSQLARVVVVGDELHVVGRFEYQKGFALARIGGDGAALWSTIVSGLSGSKYGDVYGFGRTGAGWTLQVRCPAAAALVYLDDNGVFRNEIETNTSNQATALHRSIATPGGHLLVNADSVVRVDAFGNASSQASGACAGACAGLQDGDCSDGNRCTFDGCDAAHGGRYHTSAPDGMTCFPGLKCSAGVCQWRPQGAVTAL
jgi:hypothetical protein